MGNRFNKRGKYQAFRGRGDRLPVRYQCDKDVIYALYFPVVSLEWKVWTDTKLPPVAAGRQGPAAD